MSIVTVVPNLDLNLEHRDVIVEGSSDVSVRQWISTNYSNTALSFSCPPPSLSTFIERCIFLTVPVVITYTGTTTGAALLQNGYDALRAYPLSSIITNSTMTINNQTFTIQTRDVIPYLARYFCETSHTTFPSFLDKSAVYADLATSINNPLGSYFNSVDGFQPRGGFPTIIVNGATSSTLSATIIEPVFIPPLQMSQDKTLGFSNVRTMDFVFNFSSSLSRIVSHAISNATLTNVAVAIQQPTLTMKYYSPKPGYVPRALKFGTHEIVAFPTTSNTALTSNSSTTMVSSNIQLNAIPSHIYVFVRESNANLTYQSTDTFCNISGINITFNNVTGILSTCTEVDLYNIARANGLMDSWEAWKGYTTVLGGAKIGTAGSILKLCFAKDITLRSDDFVGKTGAYNLLVNATVTNYNQQSSITNPTLYIIAVTPGSLTFHETGSIDKVLGVSRHADSRQYIPYNVVRAYYGGSFMDVVSRVSSYLKPINDWLRRSKAISSVASSIPHPAAHALSSLASSLGYGEGEGEGMEDSDTEEMGGRVLSRQDLKRRLRNLD